MQSNTIVTRSKQLIDTFVTNVTKFGDSQNAILGYFSSCLNALSLLMSSILMTSTTIVIKSNANFLSVA